MEKIHFSTQLWFGDDALSELQVIQGKKIFIVTDPFIVESGMATEITKHITNSEYFIFSDIVPDPPIEKVIAGIQAMSNFGANTIIAIGGGSAIDAAKAMKYFGKRTMNLDIEQFIAIPTTSGTGSEVTNFAVITVAETATKYPLVTDEIQPDIAILDTNMVMSVPPKVTADTGMDVLTHVIEAYVSKEANGVADAFCEKVVKLVFDNLETAYKDGSNRKARANMHLASCMAGMAFNLTSLGLNHGIAHAAGARLHVPHGRMNAILLPNVIEFNANVNQGALQDNEVAKRYMALANCIGTTTTNPRIGVQNLVRAIKQLRQRLSMPATLSEFGLSKSDVLAQKTEIAIAAMADNCTDTNPRHPSVAEIEALIQEIS
ncbi:iron-containing alcohol dehydrogenase [Enterococcus asini]|uniref:1-propanol dehydrogenase PduQ n=1 Tax=Enterococcus asini TaxID=57732 RepID=UPI00288CA24B|nr:1-propanol dehydrogenase PduQ [Enterococcus asini]MDT2757754.1 iron-containing alcohol dehydrogenase [Enterococcus asini]